MAYRRLFWGTILASTLLGCGPGVSDSEDSAAGDSATEGESDGNSDTNMGTTAPGSDTEGDDAASDTIDPSDTDSAGDTESEPACELPQGDDPGEAVATITIRNDSDAPRFISPYSSFGCNYSPVEISDGNNALHWDHPRVYPYSCDLACGWGCSDGGDQGMIINPGATATVEWNGGVWTETPLSPACQQQEQQDCEFGGIGDSCEVLRFAAELEYTVTVHVSDACPDGVDTPACDCIGDVCEMFVYEPGQGEYTVQATAVFPAGAEIVLQ